MVLRPRINAFWTRNLGRMVDGRGLTTDLHEGVLVSQGFTRTIGSQGPSEGDSEDSQSYILKRGQVLIGDREKREREHGEIKSRVLEGITIG